MISVIIPLFNKEKYIARAVESVLHQTAEEFECIVVDDGSTDSGPAIVRKISDPRVKLVRQQNGGASRARNRGVAAARSELIALLDADDEWLPRFLSVNIEMHRAFPGIVASFTNYLRSETCEVALSRGPRPSVLNDYYAFCYANFGFGMSSSSVVMARSAFERAGGFPETRAMGEDLDTWFRLATIGPVAFCPEVHAIYHTGIGITARARSNWDVWDTFVQLANAGRLPEHVKMSAEKVAVLFRYLTVRDLLLRRDYEQAKLMVGVLAGARFGGGYIGWAARMCLRYRSLSPRWIFALGRPVSTSRYHARALWKKLVGTTRFHQVRSRPGI